MYYAGIGSRSTPPEVLEAFEWLASELAKQGYVLRSGGAGGADSAFEAGCDLAGGQKEIYLPWKGFNGSSSPLHSYANGLEAMAVAERYHPNFQVLKPAAKSLMARNSFQVLGADLKTPSSFVVCWTEGGKGGGGTGQALRIARDRGIKVCDFGRWPSEQALTRAAHVLETIRREWPATERGEAEHTEEQR